MSFYLSVHGKHFFMPLLPLVSKPISRLVPSSEGFVSLSIWWSINLLIHWLIHLLGWSIGSLVYQLVGLSDCWSITLLLCQFVNLSIVGWSVSWPAGFGPSLHRTWICSLTHPRRIALFANHDRDTFSSGHFFAEFLLIVFFCRINAVSNSIPGLYVWLIYSISVIVVPLSTQSVSIHFNLYVFIFIYL